MPLRTVFLDAGGVLLFPNWTRVSDALSKHGVAIDAAALAAAEPIAKKQIDDRTTIAATNDAKRGWLYFNLILTAAGVPLSEATAAALDELHEYHQQRNLWEYVPAGVAPALNALNELGLRLTVVSNANGTLCAHLDRLGLSRHVHCVLDSCDLGVEKPDPRLFEIALERSGASADTTIHVGDLYQVDVVGARAAGVRGVLLDEYGLYVGVDCPRVRSLAELVTRIKSGEFDDA
jgi:HAD superfamily hydrolase (TIGR01509 family)